MRSVTIVLLHAFIVPGLADESVDKLTSQFVDKLGDKLVDRLFRGSSLQVGNLDDVTSAKTHADKGVGPLMSKAQARVHNPAMFANMPGNPALKKQLIDAMEATNGRCYAARDVAMKAEAVPRLTGKRAEPLTVDQVQDMAGVTSPMGLFDPLGIASNVPQGQLLFYREAELKHGRVCMIAFLGLLVAERHDFIPFFGDYPMDKAAYLLATPFVTETPIQNFWPAAMALFALEEVRAARNNGMTWLGMDKDVIPGDYGFDPLGIRPKNDPKAWKEIQNRELNNGRLAMFATAGLIAQEQVTGHNVFFNTGR